MVIRQRTTGREMVAASPVSSTLLVPLSAPEAHDASVVGSKAASLADCAAAGFPVPEGAVLTVEAFRRVGGQTDANPGPVRRGALPAGVEETLLKAWAALGGGPVAVRSSAVAEDLAGSSFAGQYETVLGVRKPEQLVEAVRICWASAVSRHARAYRIARKAAPAAMAVLIQRQVASRAAGVAFSADPVSGDRTVAVIDAMAGLGDRRAAGDETPETWRVPESGAPAARDGAFVLTAAEAVAVAKLARDLAARRGVPQDIEWALDDAGLWLLQARPITALPAPPAPPVTVPVEPPDGFWERDASHWPAPHSPLGRSITYPSANAVTPELCRNFGMLAERIELTDIGGWHYVRTVPLGGKDRKPPPALVLGLMARLLPTMRARARTAREVVRDGRGTEAVERWWQEWQPTLLARHEALLAVGLPQLSDESLVGHFESVNELLRDGLGSHMQVVGAVMIETAPLLSTAPELLGWEPLRALELVAGLSFRSSEPARELARLAERARSSPAILAALEDIAPETPAWIAESDPVFAADFETYRWYYGARGLSRDPADPTIADRPELLLRMLAGQIVRGHDPSELDRLNGAHRARRLEEARGALRTRTGDERARFDAALARAERAYPLREDNVFVALQAPLGLVRYAALDVGRRLADRGQVDQPADVFFLEYADLIGALRDGRDARDVVLCRKGERAWVLAHPGPASYGTPPGPPPSLRYLPREARELTEAFFGFMSLALDPGTAQDSVAAGIHGVPGSPGRHSGPARVVIDEGHFDKIEPGDVVVCPVTQPTWSVIFPLLGAVVTDSGGVLSHPAIIAREFRIPAVVATGNATSLLRDGEIVTVDGTTGTVEIRDGA